MRKSKFSETQIVAMLKDAESGVPVADLTREHGVSKATFFKWRSKYGGATVSRRNLTSRGTRIRPRGALHSQIDRETALEPPMKLIRCGVDVASRSAFALEA